MVMKTRRAFSLVELIFTIILLGIIFVTVASLLFKSVELDIASFEGEALYRAAALMQRVTAQPHNSALLGDLNISVSATSSYPKQFESAGRIADYPTIAAFDQNQCRGFAGVTGTGRQGETTRLFADYINAYATALAPAYTPVPVRFVRVCAGPSLTATPLSATFRPEDIVAPSPNAKNQMALNHWNGYVDDHDNFVLTVVIEPFNEPDPRPGGLWNKTTTTSWGNLEGRPSDLVARNLILIKITASFRNSGEVIGELRYVASNIGALQ
ncbi:hypothetical protein FACS189487_03150 [Campylobacterota bacterium]|nr:hypothetical protein FACS189487_03150 [Campylobacterota bacterium]